MLAGMLRDDEMRLKPICISNCGSSKTRVRGVDAYGSSTPIARYVALVVRLMR